MAGTEKGTIPDIAQAAFQFCDYAADQLRHLETEMHEGVAYVGRRLDQTWRWLDYTATLWIEPQYQKEVAQSDLSDVGLVIEKLARSPEVVNRENPSNAAAAGHLGSAASAIRSLIEESQRRLGVREAAVAMYLARREYSAYRVTKYLWLEHEYRSGRYSPSASYRWLEA